MWVRRVLTFLGIALAIWLVVVVLLWSMQRRLIYLPDRTLPPAPAGVTVEAVETDDGVEHRPWVVPAEGEPVARVVVFAGNAGNRAGRVPLARSLSTQGMEAVLFDYRGYGDTDGSPTEDGLIADGEAVARFASDTDLPLVFFGESIGGAVAVAVAPEVRPAAVVLRSPFTSLADVARIHYRFIPTGMLLRDRFEVEDRVRELGAPLLVVLGTADTIVPPRLSRRVHETAPEPKELVELEGFNHNDPGLAAGEELASVIRRFLDANLQR